MFIGMTDITTFDKLIENSNFSLIKDYKFGPKYYLGTAIIKKEDYTIKVIDCLKRGWDADSLPELPVNTDGPSLLFVDPGEQFGHPKGNSRNIKNNFHCLYFRIMKVLTLNETIENVKFLVTEADYKWLKIGQSDPTLSDMSFNFVNYLKILSTKPIEFLPFDLKNIEDGIYKLSNYVLCYIPNDPFGVCREDLDILQKNVKLLESPLKNAEKIYMGRRQPAHRVPGNEQAMQNYFSSLGFSIVELSDYNIQDQIAIVKNAKIVAGFSGNSLANVLFSQGNQLIIELVYTPNFGVYYLDNPDSLPGMRGGYPENQLRYKFNWDALTTVMGNTHLKINFERVDYCEEAIEQLKNNPWFNKAVNNV